MEKGHDKITIHGKNYYSEDYVRRIFKKVFDKYDQIIDHEEVENKAIYDLMRAFYENDREIAKLIRKYVESLL